LLQGQGETERALTAFRQAARVEPEFGAAQMAIGSILLERGNFLEAVVAYRQAIEKNPDNADAHYNLGLALQGRERFDEAIAAFETARELYAESEQTDKLEKTEAKLNELNSPDGEEEDGN
jgi:tetratricopeptide (TPR) repeat protein